MILEGQLYDLAAHYIKMYDDCVQNYCILLSVSLYHEDWEVSSDQPNKNTDQRMEDNSVDNTTCRQGMTTNNNSEEEHATLQQPVWVLFLKS
jgi:hypothetical protein